MKKLLVLCLLICSSLSALIDLEGGKQKFILNTQKIDIEGFPDAFNPSIVRFQKQLLLVFRARDPVTQVACIIGLQWLDEQFTPVGKPQILDTGHLKSVQDPRLIIVDNRLYMPFSALFNFYGKEQRRVCIGELQYDGLQFHLVYTEPLLHFEGVENKFEKNWVPFAYNDYLLLSYSICPHKVFLPFFGEQKCIVVDYSESFSKWDWGEIRGGTPALRVGNQYLAFFHSSVEMKTKQSNGKNMPHYFMGAYTFSHSPPFNIQKISPRPIVGAGFYSGPTHKTWKPLRVVFPCGYVFDDKSIWVVYGRQDHEVWVVQLDRKGLFASLVKV